MNNDYENYMKEKQGAAVAVLFMLIGMLLGLVIAYSYFSKDISKPEPKESESPVYTETLAPTVTATPEETPVPTETPTPFISPYTDEEIDLIAILTMAEADGDSEYGKRLVIDVILNRIEHHRFPDTVEGVIYQQGQFEPVRNGRFDKCYVKEEIRQLVLEELEHRTNDQVLFFRADHYHDVYIPITQVGNHYFSTLICC